MQNSDDVQLTPVDETVVIESTDTDADSETEETVIVNTQPAGLTPDEETPNSQVNTLLHLEQMINGYLSDIERLRQKLKSQKEMYKQSFDQDKEFSEVNEEHKAVKRKHNEAKQKIAKTDGVQAVKMTIDEIQSELKDVQQSLSDYLNRYIQLTQATSFTGPGGKVLTIVRSAKLVKKKD